MNATKTNTDQETKNKTHKSEIQTTQTSDNTTETFQKKQTNIKKSTMNQRKSKPIAEIGTSTQTEMFQITKRNMNQKINTKSRKQDNINQAINNTENQ